ncbi:hypothetical protein [Micromonospora sp. IBHARD004]|uniref:hypothetical protein n=1 Tax=Micromonospora sp. IBHARD004 TaxID=3457764 RepID=UPI0040590955
MLAGAGASVLPTYLCRGELASGALRELLAPPVPPSAAGQVVARVSSSATAAVAAGRAGSVGQST